MESRVVPLAVFSLLTASFTCFAGVQEPFDTMPSPGNRLPGLEQRLRSLEKRLDALEGKPKENPYANAAVPEESEYVKNGLGIADLMLKGGNVEGGVNAYREIFQKVLADTKPTVQSLTDLFVTSCTLAMASETLLEKAELTSARSLNDDALTGLRRCRQVKPEWNAKIMDYVLKKVEQRAAELK